jgi:ABC-type uncharacterized transport system permease subunit
MEFFTTVTAGGVRLASVLALASLGETFSQRSGVLSIGLEGYMDLGTILGFAVAFYTGNPWLGLLAALAGGLMLSLIHGYLSVTLGVDQMVSGIGIIFFAEGLMCLINARVFETLPIFPTVECLNPVNIPLLSRIPVIGPILFQHSPMVYIIYFLVPLFWFVLYRTKFGLRIRAVGEFAAGADTTGVNVYRMRYIGALLSGVMGGLAGGFLSLGVARSFQGGMVAGRGFIVLAAIVLGNWNPLRIALACLLFGWVDAFQYRMQVAQWWQVPFAFWMMLPYLVTIVALIAMRRVRVPRELTIPYLRERTK